MDGEERVRRYAGEVVGDGALGVINSVVQFGIGDRHAVFKVTYTDRSNGTDDLVVRVSVLSDAAERVVHIGSDMVDGGAFGWSAYMAAKGALVGLTRGWAMELGRDGITVNLVAPGWIPVERHGVIPAEIEQERLARQPIPRWGTPDDIADAVAYLVTDGAGFILGQHRRQRRYALQLSPSTAPGGRPPRST